ncbi:hypothetical protein EcSMS35_4383 [Escherichia coli SMS-3-5]|uniref:Uncharacterized protein n=1 Tax=Escherichia coli (strain SMS-3-5 / SECEC) TaxID=439855 RepID=B1LNP6_ECOSM|nr:hypothetical protein EcSMS35_4383 [Escherichia coli SMS-3-5]ESD08540.1 hypothetical protein HMPREF1595_02348 [Escherichia coli 907672]KDW27744.1 hypothetical protein AC15_4434 [Escherichia coli 2-156-04_S3_C2]
MNKSWQLPAFVVTSKPPPAEVVIDCHFAFGQCPGNKGAFVLSDEFTV